jgi:hypothetical protein
MRGNPRTADLHILNDLTRISVRGRKVEVVEAKCRFGLTPNDEIYRERTAPSKAAQHVCTRSLGFPAKSSGSLSPSTAVDNYRHR